MDYFRPITTTSSRITISKLCDQFEQSGVPVMIQYITLRDKKQFVPGYRVLVPNCSFQEAIRAAHATGEDIELWTKN